MKDHKEKIAALVSKTIDYMESDKGRAAAYKNMFERGYSVQADRIAAIMTATGLRKYENICEVFDALGPALNARHGNSSL